MDKSQFTVVDSEKKALEVASVTLSADGKSVIVKTAQQAAYKAYTLTVGEKAFNFVGLPTDTTKPTAAAVVTSNKSVTVTFSEEVDEATAVNIANYTVDNGLTVLKAELSSTGKVVTLTTGEQKVGTIYKLTIQNVADLAGNVMDKVEPLFGGMSKDTTKPTASAVVTGNNIVEVTFNEKVSAETAGNISNYITDNGLSIVKAELDLDSESATYMKKVTLTTSEQKVGTIYKLTTQNVQDISGNTMDKYETLFGGMAKDTTKPAAPSVVVTANNKVKVTFAEKMNKELAENIANYTTDNGLNVLKAELDSTGKVIVLTTVEQKVGTIYKVTVQNLTDIAGNAMDKFEGLFGGMAKDATAPTAAVAAQGNKVVVTFNEDVDKDSATNVFNYVFDGELGYAVKAEIDGTNRIVTLTTANQTPGKIYNVTMNNIKDLSGNAIEANTKKSFVGVGTLVTAKANLQAISIVNNNTFDVIFDRELSDAEVLSLNVVINKDNSVAFVAPAGLASVKTQQSDKRMVRFQFKTDASVNPTLFDAGHVYATTITGTNVEVTNNANIKSFAGTNVQNEAPYVAAAVALNKTSVKVIFSKPVTNVTAGAFTITPAVGVSSVSVAAGGKVTEAILYLNAPIVETTIYDLGFNAGVKDAAGYVPMKLANADTTAYKVKFAGTNVANVSPKIAAILPVDKFNFDILFTEPVNNSGVVANYTVTKVSGANGANLVLAGAKLKVSDDKTKVRVSLSSATPALVSGTVYKLAYTANTAIRDLEGLVYDATVGANEVQFGGVDTENTKPTIAAIEGLNKNKIKVVFNEEIDEATSVEETNGTYAIYAKGTTNVAANVTAVAFDATTNSATLTLNTSLDSSIIYDLRVVGAVKDVNQIAADTTVSTSFAVGATEDPALVQAANDVKALISALPVKDSVILGNKAAVTAARNAYTPLSQIEKNLVGDITKLTDAETKIAELELAALPVGVALQATVETTKGVVAVAEVPAVKQIADIKVTAKATANGDITIDGETIAVLSADADAAAIATKIAAHSFTNWTVAVKDGATDTVVFTAKVAAVDTNIVTSMASTGVTVDAASTTTHGAVVKPVVNEVKEKATTTVTAGAAKAANITVNVADGAGLNKDVVVAVAKDDTAAVVAGKIQAALAADAAVNAKYAATVEGANVILTQTVAGADVALAVTLK